MATKVKRESNQPLKRGKHKGLIPMVVKVHGDPNKQQFTMYYSPSEYKRMQEERKAWCSCKKPVRGPFVPDNSCKCGLSKNHVHCLTCGKYVEVG